ncbi:Ninein [Carabus blaptoides fortunei]
MLEICDQMEHSMDPYEQQLLSVFNSYDVLHRGSLDREGLVQLCNSLQLEEQGVELIKCLLSDSKLLVTFNEFKEGLLTLLGNVQNSRQKLDYDASSASESESPDREISPKFVYGSKKYGRRSRPESTEQIELFEEDCEKMPEVFMEKYENKSLKNVNKVQRSNSQTDVTHSRKRKTNGKLKRCTSFPGNHEMEKQFKNWSRESPQKESKVQSPSSEYNSNMLRSALEQLGIGTDGTLSHLELVRVCEFIGMHKLAKIMLQQIASKQESDLNRRISIEEFLEVMQKDEYLFEALSPTHTMNTTLSGTLNSTMNNSCMTEDSVLFPNSKSLQYITLGPNGSGVISSQAIIELWENAGITSGANLLQELGFTDTTIGIVDLATILEDELRSLNDSRGNDISFPNIHPHIVLLQASIALYQSEVKYLKSLLEQVSAERDKLRTDIADANHRASLLAQEVDDNHAKMEKSTQNQVRLLEQRHSDMLKELTTQFVGEKEQMTLLNTQMEQKILTLETEEAKFRSDLCSLQQYSTSLEKENHSLTSQLTELEHVRTSLAEKVNLLENECQKISDMERERDQLAPLLEKLSILQVENAELRDKNDELCTEVETLNSQVAAMRVKMSSTPTLNVSNQSGYAEENVSSICEGVVGLGAIKRRVDSPSKDNECSMETESPRLGKVRRCYQQQQQKNQPTGEVLLEALGAQMPLNSSESGFEAELDCLDSSLSFTGSEGCTNEEVNNLQSRIAYLEQLLLQHSIKLPGTYTTTASVTNIASTGVKHVGDHKNEQHTKAQLVKRCKELESVLEEVQLSFNRIISEKSATCKEKCDLINPITQLSDKLRGIVLDKDTEMSASESISTAAASFLSDAALLKVDSTTETDHRYIEVQLSLEEKLKVNQQLTERCDDLEQALELLRNEFENCENYWSNKLDEERQMFEQEQKQSSDKLTELLVKMSEYEEQFAAQDNNAAGRLSPIDEKGCLEQQFTELEEEYAEFKTKMEAHVEMKDKEIATLQKKVSALQSQTQPCDASVQVSITEEVKLNQQGEQKTTNLSNVIVSTNIFSSETLPSAWQYSSKSNSIDSIVHNPNIPERDYVNPTAVWIKQESEPTVESGTSSMTDTSVINTKCDNQTCSLPPNLSWHSPATVPPPQPHSLNYIPEQQGNNNCCRPKRSRKHDRSIFTSQLRQQKKEQDILNKHGENDNHLNGQHRWNSINGEQTCVVPLNSIHHLHGRLRELDQHCRHLQFILKQQQRHSESVMHHCWQQHREEANEMQLQIKALQDKLGRSDMLIKDLYVENTYLMANNQRLEHRCHMLVQCSSESTSV